MDHRWTIKHYLRIAKSKICAESVRLKTDNAKHVHKWMNCPIENPNVNWGENLKSTQIIHPHNFSIFNHIKSFYQK
jgi:hypothetical protein